VFASLLHARWLTNRISHSVQRSQSFWSFLPRVKEPLWVSLCSPSVPLEPVEFIDYDRSNTASVRNIWGTIALSIRKSI
jgi:hypothetical protein